MSSKFLDFLFGYESSEKKFEESHHVTLGKHFAAKIIGNSGRGRTKAIISHPVIKFFSHLHKSLACLPIKTYGAISLFFGISTLLMNFAEYYFQKLPDSPAFALIIGAIFTFVSIPLICIDCPLAEFLQKHTVTDTLFFEILCLRRIRKAEMIQIEFKWLFPIIIGVVIAAAGFILPLSIVLISIFALVIFSLALSSPEFMFVATIFSIPIFPLIPNSTTVLCVSVALMLISFAIKVIVGKRQFHFEQYDFIIIAFMLFVLISGIFLGGIQSFKQSLAFIMLTSTYFVASNIIVNRRVAEGFINVFLSSSIPTAIYAIINYYVSPAQNQAWLDSSFEGKINARATGTFGNPNIYAVFLLVVIIFSAIFAADKSIGKKRYLYIFPLIINTFAMVLTWTRGAWIALILSAAAYIVIRSRKCTKLMLIPIIALPLLILIMPASITDRFLSSFNPDDSSVSSRLSVLRSSLAMFRDNIFAGVGIGENAFSKEFLKYAEDSVTAPHSHNLFLEIGCEAGIFALILFIYLLIIRIRHRASYAKYVRNSSVDHFCTMSGTALFALLAFGMTDYIWYNSQMLVLFFAVFGIGSATLRISKNEYNEAILSTLDDDSDTAAEINISIGKRE